MGHVHFTREHDLPQCHVHHLIEDAETFVEEVAPGSVLSARLHSSLLIRNRTRILDDECPKYKFVERRVLNLAEIVSHPAHYLNKYKSNSKHHHRIFAS